MEEKKKCPYCGEEILAVAKKCKHCGEWLDKKEKAEPVIEKQPAVKQTTATNKWKVIISLVILAIIIGGYLVISNHQSKPSKDAVVEKVDSEINFAEPEEDAEGNVYQNKKSDVPSQQEQNSADIPVQNTDDTNIDVYNSEDLLSLGEQYEKGIGVEEDHEAAFYYYEKAANTGDPAALNKLGNMYAQGKGCVKDMYKAASYYLAAAEKGNKYAQHNIAFCYWDGVGVEKDCEAAVMWMRRSAAQGYEKAQKALKTMGVE